MRRLAPISLGALLLLSIITLLMAGVESYWALALYKLLFLAPPVARVLIDGISWRAALFEGISWHAFVRSWRVTALLSLGVAAVYAAAYLIASPWLNPAAIRDGLALQLGLSPATLLAPLLFILLINSFLEEYFWRGYVFAELSRTGPPWQAHAVAAGGFAAQHLLFMASWVAAWQLVLAGAGLVLFALVLHALYARGGLLSCWVVHLAADAVQVWVALHVFGLA